MNVLIAKNTAECAKWKDTAVVIDVLRSTATVCVLLGKSSVRPVVVCPDEPTAQTVLARQKGFALLSEYNLSLKHGDDSPFIAGRLPARQPVCLVSAGTGLALQYLRNASTVLLGGFCNFRAVVKTALAQKKDILLVPAAVFQGTQDEEDFLCAQAFKEFAENISTPEKFLEEFNTTVRFMEFSRSNLPTALDDLQAALTLDGFSIVPRSVCSAQGTWAVCFPYGKRPDPAWATLPDPEKPTTVQQPQFATMLNVDLRPMVDKTILATGAIKQQTSQKKKVPPQDPPAEQLRQITALGDESAAGNPEKGLKKLFSKFIGAPKEEKSAPAITPPPVEPQGPKQPQGPVQLGASKAPHAEQTPEQIAEENAKTHIDLSEGKTVWNISKPRPGMFAQVPEDETMHVRFQPEVQEEIPQAAPITQDPNPARPRERVLELSVFEHGDTALPLGKGKTPLPQAGTPKKPAPQPAAHPARTSPKKAIVLFSGGLDSTTCLYWARAQGYECEALTVSYGQRHKREIAFAKAITRYLGIKHHLIDLKLPWLAASSLVDSQQPLPDIAVDQISHAGVPSTYVPGRNLMFLSIAGSLLDAVGADAIIAGPNAIDFSGYPDCTPGFFKAAGEALNRGTTRGVREGIEVLAPLMDMNKADIVRLAVELKVPLKYTWSCYAGGEKPCGKCDSCKLRAKGFKEAGYKDPAL